MSKPSFKVRFPDAYAPSIYYDITIGRGKRLRGKTNSVLHPKTKWDQINKVAVGDKKEASVINLELSEFEDFVMDQFWKLRKYPNLKDELKNQIEIYFDRLDNFEDDQKLSLKQFIAKFIDEKKNEVGDQAVSKGTIGQYENFEKILLAFEKNRFTLSFDTINRKFYNEYTSFLGDSKKFSANTIGKHIKMLKAIMTAAHVQGFHNNLIYKSFIKPVSVAKDVVYLNKHQLEELSKLKLTGRLAASRDYFLLMSYTGIRVQDMLRLTNDNIVEFEGEKMISYSVSKTKKELAFVITDEMEAIFEKNGGFPRMKIFPQYINTDIKELTQNDQVSCHTARRSYCTNSFLDGLPVQEIMHQSGHAKEATFYTYIKAGGREIVAAMSKRRKSKQLW